MERQTVVIAFLRVGYKVFNRLGRLLFKKHYFDCAIVFDIDLRHLLSFFRRFKLNQPLIGAAAEGKQHRRG